MQGAATWAAATLTELIARSPTRVSTIETLERQGPPTMLYGSPARWYP